LINIPRLYKGLDILNNYWTSENRPVQKTKVLFFALKELAPIRQKYHEIIKNPEHIDDLLRDGLLKVKRHSAGKERQILRKVGLSQ